MSAPTPLPARGSAGEVEGLVEVLLETDERLRTLLAGQVDSVTSRNGQTLLLRHAQGDLRDVEAARQAVILGALPAHIALLDARGLIMAVNEKWRQSALPVRAVVGADYPRLCDAGRAVGGPDGHEAAAGMRAVLRGSIPSFAYEYVTAPGAPQAWYQMTVTPLRPPMPGGAVVMHIDITERERAEDDLRKSKAFLSMAGRLAATGAWSLQLTDLHLVWSDEVCAIHELAPGQRPGLEEALAFYTPGSAVLARSACETCATTGEPFDLELELVTARGRRRWVRAMGEAVRDERGSIRQIQGAFQDLSERKDAERASSRLSARLTHTLEHISEGFFALDRKWRFTQINREAERLLGRADQDLLGQLVWGAFPAWTDSEFSRALRHAMRRRTAYSFEAFDARRNAWFYVNAFPAEDGLSVYFRDVTVERAARRQLDLLEASVSQLRDMVVITEAGPLERPGPRIVFVNDAFVRITGHAREAVLGQSPRLLQGPLTDRAVLARMREGLSRQEPVHAELVNYTRAGLPYWIEIDIVPVGEAGLGITHFVAIERDITERKRDQDVLRELNDELESRVLLRTVELKQARDEADRANQAKSAFLAAMSHEIRTPMNGVIGMTEVLRQTELQHHQVEMVDLIRDSGASLLKIIEDILDFSKIEAGKLSLEVRPMDLGELVENVCGMLDPMAVKRGVRMTVFVDPALPQVVHGDGDRLRQVLLNLISNAIKFSGGGDQPGRVSVRATRVGAGDGTPDGIVQIELSVTDNGIGIEAAAQQQLFRPYLQADPSTSRRFGGTGLGLSISRMLVHLMGGEIAVQSQPGQGARFAVSLALPQAPDPTGWQQRPVPSLLPCRIVGRGLPLREDLRVTLQAAGARVEMHPDLSAALAAPLPGGPSVWLILPGATVEALAPLRALVAAACTGCQRFVLLGWGSQRRPRIVAADLLLLDLDSMRRETLLRLLAPAEAGAAPVAASLRPARSAAPAPALARIDPRWRRARILVAEDNETNQTLVVQQLKLIGLAADVVGNGREALARWELGGYDLLLTDLRMPDMDGYHLVAAIRAAEPAGTRLPVIALTANGLQDEAGRCLAAGMDACLRKPVPLAQLRQALEHALAQSPGAASLVDGPPAVPVIAAQPVDLAVLAALVGDETAVLEELLFIFAQNAAQARLELRAAIDVGDLPAALAGVHKFKSAVRSIGANQLDTLCERLESAASSGSAAALQTLWPEFERELARVLRFVQTRPALPEQPQSPPQVPA